MTSEPKRLAPAKIVRLEIDDDDPKVPIRAMGAAAMFSSLAKCNDVLIRSRVTDVQNIRYQTGRPVTDRVFSVHRDVPIAGRGRRALRVRVGRRPQRCGGAQHQHGRPVDHRFPGEADGAGRHPGRDVRAAVEDGRRPDQVVRHVPVRLPPVRHQPRHHRRVRRVHRPVARRRGGPQTVPDRRARVGHRQPDVLPAARRERDMVVGRQRPVPPDRVPVGVQRPGLPGPRSRGARLRRVRVRVEKQFRGLRAQRDRFVGRVHDHRARHRIAVVAYYSEHRHDGTGGGDRRKLRVTGA